MPPVPSLFVQLWMHAGMCRHAWFRATKCLRSPYYPRTRNDVQTEVPRVTIAIQRCRRRLLMPCSKRKGFMGATHLFLCTRASALASPELLESRSRPAILRLSCLLSRRTTFQMHGSILFPASIYASNRTPLYAPSSVSAPALDRVQARLFSRA